MGMGGAGGGGRGSVVSGQFRSRPRNFSAAISKGAKWPGTSAKASKARAAVT
jgi:hypothetical protein